MAWVCGQEIDDVDIIVLFGDPEAVARTVAFRWRIVWHFFTGECTFKYVCCCCTSV